MNEQIQQAWTEAILSRSRHRNDFLSERERKKRDLLLLLTREILIL